MGEFKKRIMPNDIDMDILGHEVMEIIDEANKDFPTLKEVEEFYGYGEEKDYDDDMWRSIWMTLSIRRREWQKKWFG